MEYQYAPDFLNLLVETIARLSKSKRDVLTFFRGAGVPVRYLNDLSDDLKRDRAAHSKFDLARFVLVPINEAGDACLAQRREVVKRVVEFEDFTRCWDSDVLPAKGLVSEVRRLVNIKDSFTRMNIERERERETARAARSKELSAKREGNERIEGVKAELFALFGERDAQRRGNALESVLNRLFQAFDILVREAFVVRTKSDGVVEQIDGAIELDGHIYLVEMKWWATTLGPGETAQHLVRVFGRSGSRGLYISASGYTPAAITQYRDALRDRVVVLCTLEEIVKVLNDSRDLAEHLKGRVERAILDKSPV